MSVDLKVMKNQEVIRADGIVDRVSAKRLFSLKEAAFYLGRGLYGVRELIWAGRLPVVRDGRKMFLDREDLDHYIESRKEPYSLRQSDERPINGKRKKEVST